MTLLTSARPILSCQEASSLEATLLVDADAEWSAMKRAGVGIAHAMMQDYQEVRPVPEALRVLALVGKGHNGGDALLACGELLAQFPRARIAVICAEGRDGFKPLTQKAYDLIEGRVEINHLSELVNREEIETLFEKVCGGEYIDICLDGLLGASFQPPLDGVYGLLTRFINESESIWFRGSVDVPTGVCDSSEASYLEALADEDLEEPLMFRTDFCYATGVVKAPIVQSELDCGRVRSIDFGFFDEGSNVVSEDSGSFVIGKELLEERKHLRPAAVDKRNYGHLFIVAGSRQRPGALLMAAKAAIQSGVGLVTAFVPSSSAAAFASELPEVMWFPMPESPNGFLSHRGLPFLFDRLSRASAILMGPGMGLDRQIDGLVTEVLGKVQVPVVLDADALTLKVMEFVGKRRRPELSIIATPHVGEFLRMAKRLTSDFSDEDFRSFCETNRLITVLKGPKTRISAGQEVYYGTAGGPVLARAGSGDLLAGLIAGFVAQGGSNAFEVAAQGLAGEAMARDQGQHFVKTCDLLNYFTSVMRS